METDIETDTEAPARPDGLPDQFWDAESGSVRLDELVGAYGAMASAERPPAGPEDYALELDGLLGGPDAEANRRMHDAGFTNAQAQLVYDMASSLLLPLAGEVAGELERAERETRLAERFGGEDGWRRAKGQMEAWAAANLPAGVGEALTGSVEGAAALERLMDAGEPGLGGSSERPAGAMTLDGLRRLQGDPRYWRDRDPAIVARVMEGYRRLYPGAGEAGPDRRGAHTNTEPKTGGQAPCPSISPLPSSRRSRAKSITPTSARARSSATRCEPGAARWAPASPSARSGAARPPPRPATARSR